MRGKQAPKRKIAPDTKFNRDDLAKFINYIMERGKKTVAEDIVYEMMKIISDKTQLDPVEVFETAIRNVAPTVEIKGRRVGGANYQVPIAVRSERSFTLACRWLITAAKAKKGRKIAERLAEEFIAAYNSEGTAVKKKQDTYKMAEANRAFAHFGRS
ncbi:MAG: 30S ribosomal protein S7 [Patescibacteria group bacterium]